jgi:hypothetical protein
VAHLAPPNRRSENIGVVPIVVSELKFSDVERHVFGADLVERAHHAALENRPETLNRVRVHRADDKLSGGMLNGLVGVFGQPVIDLTFVSGEQTHLVRNDLTDEIFSGLGSDAGQDAGDDIALALHGTDDRRFAPVAAALTADLAMFVDGFAADIGLVHLNDTAKLVHVLLDKSSADTVGHVPSGFERAEAHVAVELPRTHALFAGQHEVRDLEPVAERLVGVLEDGPGDDREPIAVRGALFALPMPSARFQIIDLRISASRATNALWPSAGLQIGLAGIFVPFGEKPIELGGSQLMNRLELSHGNHPLYREKDFTLC